MEYDQELLDFLNAITAKRPRTVIQHILEHGFITSEELKNTYGYNHPPRAVRDVREHGVPIITKRIEGSDGRKIGVYTFGDPNNRGNIVAKAYGRTVLAKTLKQALIEKYGSRCFVYHESMDEALLQIDHRIPYEIDGEQDSRDIDIFMLLSPSANRAKSWTCEHCDNWENKDRAFCVRCFWAYPEDYDHIAGKHERIVTIVFSGDEVADYNKLIRLSGKDNAQSFIKGLIHSALE